MPKSKALAYAEDTLGVHEVYEKALQAREELDATFSDLDSFYSKRREILDSITDREIEITVEERSQHPEASEAALERAAKISRSKDESLRKLRTELNHIESDIDGRKFDRSIAEHDIQIATARMIELGGYFGYLVQIKQDHNTD